MAPSTAAPRKSILKNVQRPKKNELGSLFPNSKKDKRKIRHEQLLSKISKSATSKSRRRRPNKQLATTLSALADALPDTEADGELNQSKVHDQVNVIKRKSLKSKPGAMKRREKIDKSERERFAMNMAQMAQQSTDISSGTNGTSSEDRWKALRGFISETMEKKPEILTSV